MNPVCYIISGPNGSGKTTFATEYLPKIVNCKNFVNVDMIAHGLSPFNSESVNIKAAKLFLPIINELAEKKETFAFETTLSGLTYIRFIKKLHSLNYKIVLFYLWIPSASFSEKRVISRVQMGGHSIPREAIYRRYKKCNKNLLEHYMPICEEIYIYNNASINPVMIAEKINNKLSILDNSIYNKLYE